MKIAVLSYIDVYFENLYVNNINLQDLYKSFDIEFASIDQHFMENGK